MHTLSLHVILHQCPRWLPGASLAVAIAVPALALSPACSPEVEFVEKDFGFDGTCVNCHAGLSAGQVHAGYKLRCVDCHGGDDQVIVPEDASQDVSVYRDPILVGQAHVRPKEGLARFFWANGIDDDGDGLVDEGPTFDDPDNPTAILDFGEIAEHNIHGEGIGAFIDAEFNRDLSYVRWLNPGDLRVATATCGSASTGAFATGSGCHQRVVDSMRRSIMVNMGAVINGAYYGNESWRTTFRTVRDQSGPAEDPRRGAFGYVLDYDAADACIDTTDIDTDESQGRGQPRFDSDCLEASTAVNDPNAVTGAPGNIDLPGFEIAQGSIGPAPDVIDGETLAHEGVNSSRFTWGGKPLMEPEAALSALHSVPDEDFELAGIPDPVDLILRGFRAYYPLNYPGSSTNFNFTFGESIKPNVDDFKTVNPFGRGHSSGCTACHMKYNYTGSRDPQLVSELQEDGSFVDSAVSDPTTRHREFDPETQDVVTIEGAPRLVGVAVTSAERDAVEEAGQPREQQRYYSADHQLTTRITTQQCGLCHGFVTRINYALQGMAEDEQRDPLARDVTIAFATPEGTDVRILPSWVFENQGTLIRPEEALDVIALARERDAQLASQGLLPGAGGCAAAVFTEDCNNNGELDRTLILERVDEHGDVLAQVTIDEDLNGNGALDLIDHVPREESVDGRQLRYVYGGANGATRLMDIHFERGMHCIDCHMLQDSHGDGNLYHTNWEAIEIECEDCHGSERPATLFTSGPNGGNDLRGAVDTDGRPFFEQQGERVIQRSRVTPGLFWYVPQLPQFSAPESDDFNPRTALSHAVHTPQQAEPGGHNIGSTFAGAPGQSELTGASLECYTCHTSWVHNCLGCHVNVNFSDQIITTADAAGSLSTSAGENETWFNNRNQAGRTNFQLLSLMRSPFILGYGASADGQRLAPFRSSMQVHLSISDPGGDILFDNLTFSTHQNDANTGRQNVATSGAALNQTLPHTVRPLETKSCEQCHALVDRDGSMRNDHILAQTLGIGAGRYPYVGDWALLAGTGGLELYDHKEEQQLGGIPRFPGIIVDATDRVAANVEPNFAVTDEVTDVAHIRNFTPAPSTSGEQVKPTLRDLAVMTVNQAGQGQLVISDISRRGHSTLSARPELTDPTLVTTVDLSAGPVHALAHLAPDISDPFVYVAHGTAGVSVVEILASENPDTIPSEMVRAQRVITVAIPGGLTATEIALAGDLAYVGTVEGTVEVFDLSDPRAPVHVGSAPAGGAQINGLAVAGFFLYAATDAGLAILDISVLRDPSLPPAASDILAVSGFAGREVFYSAGHAYVAAGADGVLDIDVTEPARPAPPITLVSGVDAQDVVINKVPGQTWLLVADANGDLVGHKFGNLQSTRERCLPDSSACGLDMDFRDPTIMGRDPDPAGAAEFRQAATIVQSGRRLARPAIWEKIAFHDGRRYRDSFMPGSGVLSRSVMRRMFNVKVCEVEGTADRNGNGLGDINLATGGFFGGGPCPPLDGGPPAPAPAGLHGLVTGTARAMIEFLAQLQPSKREASHGQY